MQICDQIRYEWVMKFNSIFQDVVENNENLILYSKNYFLIKAKSHGILGYIYRTLSLMVKEKRV